MTARIARNFVKRATRVHIHVPKDWLKLIDKAAKQKGLTRANLMSTASHAAALKVLEAK